MILVKAILEIWQISHTISIFELFNSKIAILKLTDLLQMASTTNEFLAML